MKLALFGGTFDPLHNGHLALARGFAERLGLDQVLLMPTALPPHKLKTGMAAGAHRAEMCRRATAGDPLFAVSELELRRGGASFTADTLDALTARYPGDTWYLLTGADMFLTLGTWFRFPDIAKKAVLCAAPRDGVPLSALKDYASVLTASGAHCAVEDIDAPAISSTDIRQRIQSGKPWETLVPKEVAAYIREHELYTDKADAAPTTEEQLIGILRRRLTPYRFAHSLAVAREAERLARKYGADPDKARTAGLLHDILKDTDPAEQLQIARDFAILLDDVEKNAPNLWHARLGAVFAEHILKITDPDILNAIRYHTTGRAHMSLLEQVVFIADFTAEGRQYSDVDTMRQLADCSLSKALGYSLRYLIDDLTAKGRTVHPDTLAAYRQISA